MLGTILGTTNTETERPYDTPLCEYTRPKEAYNDISDRFSQITRIVTSPFVRCVQTAAAIAAQMPTEPEIFVNRNLGEKYSTLRTYTENNPIKRLTFQELTSDELERVFKQAYKDAGSKEFKGKVMLREDPKWNEFNDDRAWFNMLDTEIKKEIRQKGDGTLLLITHGDVARIINNHDKDFDNTGIRLWLLDYCGYYTNISEPTKPDEFSTEWKAGKFIISAAVGQSINK
jgi:broad specificity phosphatase PhoE